MARTQPGPSGRRPPLGSSSGRGLHPRGAPPERARCPRPLHRVRAEAPARRTSPERGGLTGHAPEPCPAPWEPSACTRRAGGSPSRAAALRRPLLQTRWPACAGREPGWPLSPPTVRLAGGRAGRGTEPAPQETSGFEYVCGAARQGAESLGSGTQVHGKGRMLGNQEAGTCQLSSWGPQKAHIGELRDSRKIPLSVEFSQGTRGVRFCLGFEPWT